MNLMNMFEEYASWVKENESFYNECKHHELSLYERFMPIYEVLKYINDNLKAKTLKRNEDIDKIFSVGFEYLHDQVENSKMYLDLYFKGDFHEFMKYDELLSLHFYIEDIRYELSEKEIEVDEKELDKLLDQIESMIQHHKAIPDHYSLYVDDKIHALLQNQNFEFYGIIDIFVDVAETFGLYLYEDEDFILGKDI